MREIVYDLEGVPVELGDSIGRGGEAEVFFLQRRSNILVKWYHPEVLQKRGSELYEKIEAMRKIEALRKVKSLSWPLIQVYRDAQRRNWIGFAMYRAHGVPIFKMAHPMLYKRYFPQIDRHHLILYLIDLIDKIKLLHGSGVMIGDYNLQNILCATNNEQVMLLCQRIACFTPAESKILIRALYRKSPILGELNRKFINQGLQNGYVKTWQLY